MSPSRWLVAAVYGVIALIVVTEFGPAGLVVAFVCVMLIVVAVAAANRSRGDSDEW